MINKKFLGILKKYESVRVEENIFVKVLIKHIDHGGVQTFLNSFAKKLGLDNIEPLFIFPVRWKRMVIDTSDYVRNSYNIKFGEADVFTATLEEIAIVRKFTNDSEVFEYSLSFIKEVSADTLDRLITEAYLNYKEENADGNRVLAEFDVNIELVEKLQEEEQLETSIL